MLQLIIFFLIRRNVPTRPQRQEPRDPRRLSLSKVTWMLPSHSCEFFSFYLVQIEFPQKPYYIFLYIFFATNIAEDENPYKKKTPYGHKLKQIHRKKDDGVTTNDHTQNTLKVCQCGLLTYSFTFNYKFSLLCELYHEV